MSLLSCVFALVPPAPLAFPLAGMTYTLNTAIYWAAARRRRALRQAVAAPA